MATTASKLSRSMRLKFDAGTLVAQQKFVVVELKLGPLSWFGHFHKESPSR